MRRLLTFLLLAAGLGAPLPVRAAEAPKPETGQVVLSITLLKEWVNDTYTVFIRRVGEKTAQPITYHLARFMQPILKDFTIGQGDGEYYGAVLIRSLPAGDYEITAVGGYSDGEWKTANPDFAIPVRIDANRAVYVGSFRSTQPHIAHNFWGKAYQTWPYAVSDQSRRDLPIAQVKGLTAPVDLRIIDARLGHTPYLTAE